MKIKLCLLLQLLTVALAAQRYGHVWQFGTNAGIDFNYCPPLALTNGTNTGFEGCSSVSDETTGGLLFYTNSDKVWNSQHSLMPNGNLVGGGGSLSQVLIIKKPLSKYIYYIFTTKLQGSGTLKFSYHTIDMSLNNGLGGVLNSNNVITTSTVTEQVAATLHSNGTDIWVMTHEYGTNNFLAYAVTSAGVNTTAVVSSVGPAQITGNSNFNARGEIKFSPNGLKLAFNGNGTGTNVNTNILTLFDFNNNTGAVTNPLNLPFARGDFGLSFSGDNSKLYGSTWKAFNFTTTDYNYIYQFDLSSGSPTTIVNSRVLIDSTTVGGGAPGYGSLKLAPDGKIYVARNNSGSLGVINSPNLAGSACNYVSNGFYLNGKTCRYGLNNYIEYTTYPSTPPALIVASSSPSACSGQQVILSASGADSYTWSPGSQQGATLPLTASLTTTYTVVATNNAAGCDLTASITQYASPCVSIPENLSFIYPALRLFPNPGKDVITMVSNDSMRVTLYNNKGEAIKNIELSEKNDYSCVICDLPDGVYFLYGQNSEKPVKQKIVIMH